MMNARTVWMCVAVCGVVFASGCEGPIEPADSVGDDSVVPVDVGDPVAPTVIVTPADAATEEPVLLAVVYVDWEPTSLQVQKIAQKLQAEAVETEHQMMLTEIDADATPELVEELDIKQYPTLLVYRGGTEYMRWEGPADEAEVRESLAAMYDADTQTDPEENTMTERTDMITFGGAPLTLVGTTPAVGDAAPDATLLDNDLNPVTISSFAGKVMVVSVVPSLDTGVCDLQTRRFNEEAAGLGDDVQILTISMDLPFAQARWCGAAGVDQLQTLSDHRTAEFGDAYGLTIKELRLLARAVLVIDADGVVRYVQIVPEVTEHPDYDAAIAAAKALTE